MHVGAVIPLMNKRSKYSMQTYILLRDETKSVYGIQHITSGTYPKDHDTEFELIHRPTGGMG